VAGTPENFPVKPVKPQRPTRHGHAYILQRDDGAIWLQTRAEKGLLAKMTEVPGSSWTSERDAPTYPNEEQWHRVGQVVHIFTHFRLELDVWQATTSVGAPSKEGWWCLPSDMGDQALPSLYKKVLAVIAK
jgi:A/G-specific adenine glycosylase